jgi:glutathione S-transferase
VASSRDLARRLERTEHRMRLHGALASPYVARVVFFASLKGIALEPRLPDGGIKSADYLAMNPMGKIPVLEVDDVAIPESEVICEYLEDHYPDTGGLPGSPADRAHARLVSRIHDVYVAPGASVLFRNLNPATRDEAAVAAARESVTSGFGYLAHFVTASPYAAGSQLSLADCTLLPRIAIMRKSSFPAFGMPDPTVGQGPLGRWWATMETDPLTAPFLARYSTAVDEFLASLAAK